MTTGKVKAWPHIRDVAMIAAVCHSCDAVSDPVPLVMASQKDVGGAGLRVWNAFGKIGWEVTAKAAYCPECKLFPR